MYTIYWDTRDFPRRFVVRGFTIYPACTEPVADNDPWWVGDSLDDARDSLPEDACARLARAPEDDLAIIETWF
jgi:hypothetical protein